MMEKRNVVEVGRSPSVQLKAAADSEMQKEASMFSKPSGFALVKRLNEAEKRSRKHSLHVGPGLVGANLEKS